MEGGGTKAGKLPVGQNEVGTRPGDTIVTDPMPACRDRGHNPSGQNSTEFIHDNKFVIPAAVVYW